LQAVEITSKRVRMIWSQLWRCLL